MAERITIGETRHHSKASETYVDVRFVYEGGVDLELSIPVVYRRTGVDLSDPEEIRSYIKEIYEEIHPQNWPAWRGEQEAFWATSSAAVTKPFFDVLAADVRWVGGDEFPRNDNPARRRQVLKELGYTFATRTVGARQEYLLLPIKRGGPTGYEYWSGRLRSQILAVHANYDAYEGRKGNENHLLPDHKFPEIRWDRDTARDTLANLTPDEMRNDFQLINNQRNQQKREACRACRQSGMRPYPMGIPFYYAGDQYWPKDIPISGKVAEPGCVGCGWYDLEAWRQALIAKATGGS